MKRRKWFVWIVIALLAGILLAACGGDENTNDTGTNGSDSVPESASTESADLIVESIDVDPIQPTIGQSFHIRVTIKNQGAAESGPYAITVTLRDVTREEQTLIGEFDGDPLKGGAEAILYEGDYPGVENTGSYQVQVQIDYNADSDTENNEQHQAFTVVE